MSQSYMSELNTLWSPLQQASFCRYTSAVTSLLHHTDMTDIGMLSRQHHLGGTHANAAYAEVHDRRLAKYVSRLNIQDV